MWRMFVVGLGLAFAATALAQTTSQPRTNTPTVTPQTPAVNAPTVSPQSPGGGTPTVNAPTPGVGTPTARPSTPGTASPTAGVVDCGNGSVCPAGNACLEGGLCAPSIEMSAIPGATPTSNGAWCLPGQHENRFSPGRCVQNGRVDCPGGLSCSADKTCDGNGGCVGGSPPSGPICDPADPRRCEDSSYACGSGGRCIPSYNYECQSGRVCSRQMACTMTGCELVGPTRTAQVPRGVLLAPGLGYGAQQPSQVGVGAAHSQPQGVRDQVMAKCRQLAGSLAPYRQGMGEAWYAEQLGKSSCNPDGTPR